MFEYHACIYMWSIVHKKMITSLCIRVYIYYSICVYAFVNIYNLTRLHNDSSLWSVIKSFTWARDFISLVFNSPPEKTGPMLDKCIFSLGFYIYVVYVLVYGCNFCLEHQQWSWRISAFSDLSYLRIFEYQ